MRALAGLVLCVALVAGVSGLCGVATKGGYLCFLAHGSEALVCEHSGRAACDRALDISVLVADLGHSLAKVSVYGDMTNVTFAHFDLTWPADSDPRVVYTLKPDSATLALRFAVWAETARGLVAPIVAVVYVGLCYVAPPWRQRRRPGSTVLLSPNDSA